MYNHPVRDIVTIDYIRLATWDFQVYCDLTAKLRRRYVGWRKTRWLQYTMERSQDNVSYGIAEQNGKAHGVFESSGADAHALANWLLGVMPDEILHALYCTRIDFQSTKERPNDLDYVECHTRIRKPKQLILGDDGNTLYIGNRQSNSFWRLYDKSPTDTRLEVELKGKQARDAWYFLLKSNIDRVASMYAGYLKASRVPKFLADYYQNGRHPESLKEIRQAKPTDMTKKLEWLQTLDGLVYKLCNDHDTGEDTEKLISRWYEYATKA